VVFIKRMTEGTLKAKRNDLHKEKKDQKRLNNERMGIYKENKIKIRPRKQKNDLPMRRSKFAGETKKRDCHLWESPF
jgi:hypothetical protein